MNRLSFGNPRRNRRARKLARRIETRRIEFEPHHRRDQRLRELANAIVRAMFA